MSGQGGPIGWTAEDAVLWNRGRTIASTDEGITVTVPVGKASKVITINGQTGDVSEQTEPKK